MAAALPLRPDAITFSEAQETISKAIYNALLEVRRTHQEFRAADIADQVFASVPEELLDAWLWGVASDILVEQIQRTNRAAFIMERKNQKRSVFSGRTPEEQADRAARWQGDEHWEVDDRNNRKFVGEMTGPDHRYVADQFHKRADYSTRRYQFHEELVLEVGPSTTNRVMTEEEYKARKKQAGLDRASRKAAPNTDKSD